MQERELVIAERNERVKELHRVRYEHVHLQRAEEKTQNSEVSDGGAPRTGFVPQGSDC